MNPSSKQIDLEAVLAWINETRCAKFSALPLGEIPRGGRTAQTCPIAQAFKDCIQSVRVTPSLLLSGNFVMRDLPDIAKQFVQLFDADMLPEFQKEELFDIGMMP